MRQRSLRRQKLRDAEADRREGEGGVKLDDRRGVEQRSERHGRILRMIRSLRLERADGAPERDSLLMMEHAVGLVQRLFASGAVAASSSASRACVHDSR